MCIYSYLSYRNHPLALIFVMFSSGTKLEGYGLVLLLLLLVLLVFVFIGAYKLCAYRMHNIYIVYSFVSSTTAHIVKSQQMILWQDPKQHKPKPYKSVEDRIPTFRITEHSLVERSKYGNSLTSFAAFNRMCNGVVSHAQCSNQILFSSIFFLFFTERN